MIFIAPPPGKMWTVTAGSLQTEFPLTNAYIAVWTDTAPFAPYRDPVTGDSYGCSTCVTLIRVNATNTFVPIVGGYSENLRGGRPIELRYPARLAVAVSHPHGFQLEPIQAWLRITIIEKPLD